MHLHIIRSIVITYFKGISITFQMTSPAARVIAFLFPLSVHQAKNMCSGLSLKYVTLSAKSSLMLGENKAAFFTEGETVLLSEWYQYRVI